MNNIQPTLTWSDQYAPIAVVFSFDQANEAMASYFGPIALICVDIPRSRLCATLVEAHDFFKESA